MKYTKGLYIPKSKFVFFLFILFIFLCPAAHAYGGPGVAFGALIIFCTVLLAFIASTFLSAIKYLKIFFDFLKKSFQKKNFRRKKNKKVIKD